MNDPARQSFDRIEILLESAKNNIAQDKRDEAYQEIEDARAVCDEIRIAEFANRIGGFIDFTRENMDGGFPAATTNIDIENALAEVRKLHDDL